MRDLVSQRFSIEQGTRILVQVPEVDADTVLQAILAIDPLVWGDYDRVSFTSASGVQQFRSLPGGVNAPMERETKVGCVELQIFTPARGADLERLLSAIYAAHPYEEPVIQLVEAARTRHVPGQDEGNPNRFWNRPDAEMPDWVPMAHRRKQG